MVNRARGLLAGTAFADLLVRVAADAAAFGLTSTLSAVSVVLSRVALDLQLVGWALGWAFLGLVVVQLGPLLFPVDDAQWTDGAVARFALALAAVAVGVTLEAVVLADTEALSSPLSLDATALAFVVPGALASYFLVRSLPTVRVDTQYLYGLDAAVDRHPGTVTPGRYALVVCLLGVVLFETALLFPVPELVVIGSHTVPLVGGALGVDDRYNVPGGADIAERFARGAAAVWAGVEHLALVVVVLLTTFVAFVSFGGYFVTVDVLAAARATPVATGAFVGGLLAALGLAVATSARVLERVYARTVGDVPPPAVPGALVPAGACFYAVSRFNGDTVPHAGFRPAGERINAVTALDASPDTLALLAGAAIVSVAVAFAGERGRALALPDDYAVPLSLLALLVPFVLVEGSTSVSGGPVAVAGVALVCVVALVPLPRTFADTLPEPDDAPTWVRLKDGTITAVKRSVAFAAGTVAATAVLFGVLSLAGTVRLWDAGAWVVLAVPYGLSIRYMLVAASYVGLAPFAVVDRI